MSAVTSPALHFPLLLATDGSASARRAQRLLYPLAAILPPEEMGKVGWVTLNVKPRFLSERGGASKPEPDEKTSEKPEGDNTPDWLQALVAEIPAQFRQQTLIKRGRPASEILQTAKQLSAGLIAVGEQGVETGLRDFLLGSVSNAVAHYANCHVLIARSSPKASVAPASETQETETQETAPQWRHVLLVLDGSQSTPQAIALTRQLIPVGIERVTLLSIQPPLTTQYLFGPFATPSPSWQLMQSLQEVQHEQSQQMLTQAMTALQGCNLDITALSEIAEPGVTICQIAQQQQVDLVMIGSDRRVGLAQVRLGVTGSYLIHHAPCSVLLCRPSQ
jgi:nucleotide-binding universal stress UspA family protein